MMITTQVSVDEAVLLLDLYTVCWGFDGIQVVLQIILHSGKLENRLCVFPIFPPINVAAKPKEGPHKVSGLKLNSWCKIFMSTSKESPKHHYIMTK